MNRTWIVLAAMALALAPAAFATNGYFLHGTGTASKAMAGAGVALPQEALDADTNPAAPAFVDGGYSFSLALFSPDRQYTVTGAPSGYQGTFGLTPGTVTSSSNYFPMPNLGFNYRPTNRDAWTFNFTSHGGMNTDYNASTFYGSSPTGVNLMQGFFTTTYARKLGERQSLGLSGIAAYQQFKASGLQSFAMFSGDPTALTNNGSDHSYGFGVRAGYLVQALPGLTFGASFTPPIHMSKLDKYAGLFADAGAFNIPASGSAGFAYRPAQPVTIAFDYERIHYSDVLAIANHMMPGLVTEPLGAKNGAGFGWNDINVYKLGVQWKARQDWTLRAGYSFNDQPIPSSEVLFNILAPGVIEQHWTAGVSKALAHGGKFNAAFMYAPTQTVTGGNVLDVPGQQQISLQMNEWEVEFGYSFGF